jgi:two-component system nitrogen regulation sensor histidine kinase NtrY
MTLLLAASAFWSIRTIYHLIAGKDATIPDPGQVLPLVLLTLAMLLMLATIVARKIIKLWGGIRTGSLGSRLQRRVVWVFCIVTIIPTLIVSVSSTLFFNLGIQSWFNQRISTALSESVAVAEAYLDEHKDLIRADAIAMAADLNRDLGLAYSSPSAFNKAVATQAALRSLTEALVIQGNRIIARSGFTFALAFERLSEDTLGSANHGEVVVSLEDPDKVRAIIKLDAPDTYLLIGRQVDSRVLAHMDNAHGGVAEYKRLKSNINRMQIEFSIVFIVLALLLLLAAMLTGLYFASRLLVPIGHMINAAERVRAGDYSVRLREGPKDDEIGTLTRAFNRMTTDLKQQREELFEVNRRADARRRFTEAVLAGVSAGVLALDKQKRITLANPTAQQLLELPSLQDSGFGIQDSGKGTSLVANPESRILKPESLPLITDLLPSLKDFIEELDKRHTPTVQGDVTIQRDTKTRTLHIRVTAETLNNEIEGYIVTFDDITELQQAQRSVAWADVARRVAHEIKNPLTPIQLSAERLKKKYLPQVSSDPDTFNRYIETITRHVKDIGRMVEEFVSFARLPAPQFRQEDMAGIVKKIVFSEQVAHPDIHYESSLPDAPAPVRCDEGQISQVFTNLLKNAAEAIEGARANNPEGLAPHAEIQVSLTAQNDQCTVTIRDNGPGFPPDKIGKLLEPYFTTRAKGTGLGLAIVKKILDDHKASLTLDNRPEGGAQVTIVFQEAQE